jgi:mycoredoxin
MFTTQPTNISKSSMHCSISIVVYGTSWCAASQRVRRYLDRIGIPYIYRDMEHDLEAARRVRWWTGGSLNHPTVQIGGQILVEPSRKELDQALNRASIQ